MYETKLHDGRLAAGKAHRGQDRTRRAARAKTGLIGLLLPLVVVAAGCPPVEYPRSKSYFEAPREWDRVIGQWRRKYPHAHITVPKRLGEAQYFAPGLARAGKKHEVSFRVVVVPAILTASYPISSEPKIIGGSGAGRVTANSRIRLGETGRAFDGAVNQSPNSDETGLVRLTQALEEELAKIDGVEVKRPDQLRVPFNPARTEMAFLSSGEISKLGDLGDIDAIVVVKARQLKYPVYSVKGNEERGFTGKWQTRVQSEVHVRMVDVSDGLIANGAILWDSFVRLAPENMLLLPVIVHKQASDEEVEAFTKVHHASADKAARYLAQLLKWRLEGHTGPYPLERQQIGEFVPEKQVTWVGG